MKPSLAALLLGISGGVLAAPPPSPPLKVISDFETAADLQGWVAHPAGVASQAEAALHGTRALKLKRGRVRYDLKGADLTAFDRIGYIVLNLSDRPIAVDFVYDYGKELRSRSQVVPPKEARSDYVEIGGLDAKFRKGVKAFSFDLMDDGEVLIDFVALLKAGEKLPPLPAVQARREPVIEEPPAEGPPPEAAPGAETPAPPGETAAPPAETPGREAPAPENPAAGEAPVEAPVEAPPGLFGDFESPEEIKAWGGQQARVDPSAEHASWGKASGAVTLISKTGYLEFAGLKAKVGNPGEYAAFGMDIHNPGSRDLALRLVFYREIRGGKPVKASTRDVKVAAGGGEKVRVPTAELFKGGGTPEEIIGMRILVPGAAGEEAGEVKFFLDNIRLEK